MKTTSMPIGAFVTILALSACSTPVSPQPTPSAPIAASASPTQSPTSSFNKAAYGKLDQVFLELIESELPGLNIGENADGFIEIGHHICDVVELAGSLDDYYMYREEFDLDVGVDQEFHDAIVEAAAVAYCPDFR